MSTVVSDIDLLSQWSAGSRDAGATLIDRHFSIVHRFFRNKVGSECADLVQQTFLACIEARERYRGHASFKTFLLAIARHQLFAFYRERKKHPLDPALSSVRDLGTSPSGIAARHEHERLLADALTRIPLEAQLILELAYWEGLNGIELASALELPLNTAASQLRRARLKLAEALHRQTGDRGGLADAALRSIERSPARHS
jgi:RNA polymerase sigma factor (sigma-70 family)